MDEKVKVYNFEVEGNHNYYVSEKGILVHNNCSVGAIIDAMPSSLKQLNRCKDFASELIKRMTSQGIKGEMITLKSSRNIWSDAFNMNISTNGDHVGVKVGNMVYDNLYPQGIKFTDWMMDLQVGSPIVQGPFIKSF
ncbi:papain fold toxin domain-containing protein [Chryseobacterium sp. R2ACT005]|uniref:papain fold toxin domain-containing protein n=1 Tax=Chryseobacterium sp. R2ACT005 TaxID=3416668 RepID=UPI003CF97828